MARNKEQDGLSSEARQRLIDEQVAAFLKSGGKVTEVPQGVSGQEPVKGRQHIVLGKKENKES
ncbi:hypothetical protein KCM76_13480 [Zooshikella marina]|uniref:Transcriptional regulator SutA RNAP-binding domain-containing protein n=1 Tax=Zooshikella ganghwensis TaxID=202772 RepID=A0A4P9VJR9_9GAMM|nr:hypothetical protein [Zooshikella ganghwensis]MBU2707000.1 hypothetical protein [Zooshikella ganghwensis]RDH43525.1 hypothetical protein B9G39_08765 [Zooshikella ganghwensis]